MLYTHFCMLYKLVYTYNKVPHYVATHVTTHTRVSSLQGLLWPWCKVTANLEEKTRPLLPQNKNKGSTAAALSGNLKIWPAYWLPAPGPGRNFGTTTTHLQGNAGPAGCLATRISGWRSQWLFEDDHAEEAGLLRGRPERGGARNKYTFRKISL